MTIIKHLADHHSCQPDEASYFHKRGILHVYYVLYLVNITLRKTRLIGNVSAENSHQHVCNTCPGNFQGLLTAEASCSSVMSSTNMGRTAGSSGRASAEPIISRVIPCKKNRNTQKLTYLLNCIW